MMQLRALRRELVQSVMRGTGCRRKFIISVRNVLRSLQQSSVSLQGYKLHVKSYRNQPIVINVMNEITQLQIEYDFLKILPTNNEVIHFEKLISLFRKFHPQKDAGFAVEFGNATKLLGRGKCFKLMMSSFDGTLTRSTTTLLGSVQPVYSAIVLATFARHCVDKAAVMSSVPLKDFGVLDASTMPEGYCDFGGYNGQEWLIGLHRKSFDDTPKFSEEQRQKMNELYRLTEKATRDKENEIFKIIGPGVTLYSCCLTATLQDCYNSIPVSESNRWCSKIKAMAAEIDKSEDAFQMLDESHALKILPKVPTGAVHCTKGDGVDRYLQTTELNISAGKILVCGSSRGDVPLLEAVLHRTADNMCTVWVTSDPFLKQQVLDLLKDRCVNCCFVSCPEVLLAAMANAVL
ncbi:unnamed protein product [Soboliphyme baturini]|uniref:T6PP_N domain-containing protein n=1 Tax=Soboliphyme baturini TaxID=241478 RepID=A0A183I928_9BILA|nr:unnamed protein product [Soboliphyme baturini]